MLKSGKPYVKNSSEDENFFTDVVKTHSEERVRVIPNENKTHSEEIVKLVPGKGNTDKDTASFDSGLLPEDDAPKKIVPPGEKKNRQRFS